MFCFVFVFYFCLNFCLLCFFNNLCLIQIKLLGRKENEKRKKKQNQNLNRCCLSTNAKQQLTWASDRVNRRPKQNFRGLVTTFLCICFNLLMMWCYFNKMQKRTKKNKTKYLNNKCDIQILQKNLTKWTQYKCDVLRLTDSERKSTNNHR